MTYKHLAQKYFATLNSTLEETQHKFTPHITYLSFSFRYDAVFTDDDLTVAVYIPAHRVPDDQLEYFAKTVLEKTTQALSEKKRSLLVDFT